LKYTTIKYRNGVDAGVYTLDAELLELRLSTNKPRAFVVHSKGDMYVYWQEPIDEKIALLISLKSNRHSEIFEFDTYNELKTFLLSADELTKP
jgi:hypothetical protein